MKYGLCCIHEALKKQSYRFRTMTLKGYRSRALPENARTDIITDNLITTRRILLECAMRGWNYRVSSSLIPLLSHPDVPPYVPTATHVTLFDQCRNIVDTRGIRLSLHPDQFNVLASSNPDVVKSTIRELHAQYEVFTLLGGKASDETPVTLHMNCSARSSITDIADRFISAWHTLRPELKQCLTLENEDRGIWTVENLYTHIRTRIPVPITFDWLHHQCNPGTLSEATALYIAGTTWQSTPLFHYSESLPGQPNPRRHANFPTKKPNLHSYRDLDIDLEFKDKDGAIRLMESM